MINDNESPTTNSHMKLRSGSMFLAAGLLGIATLGACNDFEERADDEAVRQVEDDSPCAISLTMPSPEPGGGHDIVREIELEAGEQRVSWENNHGFEEGLVVTLSGSCMAKVNEFYVQAEDEDDDPDGDGVGVTTFFGIDIADAHSECHAGWANECGFVLGENNPRLFLSRDPLPEHLEDDNIRIWMLVNVEELQRDGSDDEGGGESDGGDEGGDESEPSPV